MALLPSLQAWVKVLAQQRDTYNKLVAILANKAPEAQIKFNHDFNFEEPILYNSFDFQLTYKNNTSEFHFKTFEAMNQNTTYNMANNMTSLSNGFAKKHYQWTNEVLAEINKLDLKDFRVSLDPLTNNNIEVVDSSFNIYQNQVVFLRKTIVQNDDWHNTCLLDKNTNVLYYYNPITKKKEIWNLNELNINNFILAPEIDRYKHEFQSGIYLCYNRYDDSIDVGLNKKQIQISCHPLDFFILFPYSIDNPNFTRNKLETLQNMISDKNKKILSQINDTEDYYATIKYDKLDQQTILDALQQLNWFRCLSYEFKKWHKIDQDLSAAIPNTVRYLLENDYNTIDINMIFRQDLTQIENQEDISFSAERYVTIQLNNKINNNTKTRL